MSTHDTTTTVSDEELVRTFNDAANDAIDAAGCDGESDPECIYTGTMAGIPGVRARLVAARREGRRV